MALELEATTELSIIIDLAVEDRVYGRVLVDDWLLSSGDVNDAEPPHSERHPGSDEIAVVVRSAVTDRVAHRLERRARALLRWRHPHPPRDPAHRPNVTRRACARQKSYVPRCHRW